MGEQNWKELCMRIMEETDPDKLLSLVEQLNEALEPREQELRRAPHGPEGKQK